jgi:transcriptional regulator with XRE-family HTH domain
MLCASLQTESAPSLSQVRHRSVGVNQRSKVQEASGALSIEEVNMATIDDVAARAGVGRGTVSRVLNGSTKVRPATREAVEKAMTELSYQPSEAARKLALRGRTPDAASQAGP